MRGKEIVIPHSRPWINEDDKLAVASALDSKMIANGRLVQEFEIKVRDYLNVNYGIVQSSGTASLTLALRTLDIGPGDEVILPTYVCRSVLEAILTVGATPVLSDVNDFGVIDEKNIDHLISIKTKAIIAVHIFGHKCDIKSLRKYKRPIIADACQAFGLTDYGLQNECLGDLCILSFHATKCLTTGEGGMLVTNDRRLGERAQSIAEGTVNQSTRGFSSLSDLQAALGLSQLNRYPEFINRRKNLRDLYLLTAENLGLDVQIDKESNILFRFTLRSTRSFESLQSHLLLHGVTIRRGVDELLHRYLKVPDSDFPTAIKLFNQTISIPFYPSLTDEESSIIVNAFKAIKNAI